MLINVARNKQKKTNKLKNEKKVGKYLTKTIIKQIKIIIPYKSKHHTVTALLLK